MTKVITDTFFSFFTKNTSPLSTTSFSDRFRTLCFFPWTGAADMSHTGCSGSHYQVSCQLYGHLWIVSIHIALAAALHVVQKSIGGPEHVTARHELRMHINTGVVGPRYLHVNCISVPRAHQIVVTNIIMIREMVATVAVQILQNRE